MEPTEPKLYVTFNFEQVFHRFCLLFARVHSPARISSSSTCLPFNYIFMVFMRIFILCHSLHMLHENAIHYENVNSKAKKLSQRAKKKFSHTKWNYDF